jgi:hypothetical protein
MFAATVIGILTHLLAGEALPRLLSLPHFRDADTTSACPIVHVRVFTDGRVVVGLP